MTNYDNILDSNSFALLTTKELLAIGRYINTTWNGELGLVEQDFFDALITRLSDVSGDNDRLAEALLEERDARPIPPFADPEEEDCDFFDRENDSINRFCEEFSEMADVVGGDLGASMNGALGIIENLRADVGELEEVVEDLLHGDDQMNEYARCGEEEREALIKREARKMRERDERRFQEFYRNCAPKSNPPF
jgi:hypothetical protein